MHQAGEYVWSKGIDRKDSGDLISSDLTTGGGAITDSCVMDDRIEGSAVVGFRSKLFDFGDGS